MLVGNARRKRAHQSRLCDGGTARGIDSSLQWVLASYDTRQAMMELGLEGEVARQKL